MISLSFCSQFLTILFLQIPFLKSHSPTKQIPVSPTLLDSILQDYAFRSLFRHRPVTGVIYDGYVPSNFARITVSALRLRTGALRRRGYFGYKEFDIPTGVFETPYVERLVLVYQNLGNVSSLYYPLPGYSFLSPVVGLLGYNASNLDGKGSPELDLRSPENPILVKFEGVWPVFAKCVFFDLYGGVEFDNVVNGSVCLGVEQGHFGIVFEESLPAPAPAKVPEDPVAVDGGGGSGGGGGEWWVCGFLVVAMVVVAALWWWWRRCRRWRRIGRMEDAAEDGVCLAVAAVGRVMVPVAMETRTKPSLENEYLS